MMYVLLAEGTCMGPARQKGDAMAPNASRPSFRTWLRQFEGDHSAVGDLARDVRNDPDWPDPDGSELPRYEEHLTDQGAETRVLAVLRAAWTAYAGDREDPSG